MTDPTPDTVGQRVATGAGISALNDLANGEPRTARAELERLTIPELRYLNQLTHALTSVAAQLIVEKAVLGKQASR